MVEVLRESSNLILLFLNQYFLSLKSGMRLKSFSFLQNTSPLDLVQF